MAEYHVGYEYEMEGIYAGTHKPKKQNEWMNKTECTDEAINAVKDYMVDELLGGLNCSKTNINGYKWPLKDGRAVNLIISITDKKE